MKVYLIEDKEDKYRHWCYWAPEPDIFFKIGTHRPVASGQDVRDDRVEIEEIKDESEYWQFHQY